ncbi:hypothetical protein FACS1894208_00930 [Clostridia bacterium]|nr:hypothetical protein FACS1894208_00930 [Clostridia bacterium]
MNDVVINALQLIGGLVVSIGYVPQIIQLIRTKSSRDLNLKTYLSMVVGISFMEVYACNLVAQGSGLMFLVTNSLSLLTVTVMSVLIVVFRKSGGVD